MSDVQTAPKKRGRKPKSALLNTIIDIAQQKDIPVTINDQAPKKRGRKPKIITDDKSDMPAAIKQNKKNYQLDNIIIVNKLTDSQDDNSETKKNIILHLPINVDNITNIIHETGISSIAETNYENNAWISSNGDTIKDINDDINKKYESLLEIRRNDFDISKTKTAGIRKPADYTMSQFMECNKKKNMASKNKYILFQLLSSI